VAIPASVQGIVASRLDRLPAMQRRLLQTASVLGKDVRAHVLRVVCHLSSAEMDAGLAALQAAEFLYETSLGTREAYTFKHAVTQSVAYDTLLRAERRALHAEALSAIERMSGDRAGEMLERLSDHAVAGEVWPAAYRYSLGAARRANERFAWAEAITYFDRALDAIGHFEDAREAALAGIEVRQGLRVALGATGNLERCLAVMEEARQSAAWLGDTIQVAQIDGHACMVLTSLGSLDRAVAAAQRGATAAAGHAPSTLNLAFGLGQAYWFQGRFHDAAKTLSNSLPSVRGALRLASTGTIGTASVLTLVALSKTHAMLGEFDLALAFAAEARAIAAETQRPYDVAYASVAPGFAYMMQGAHDDAVAVMEEGLQVARRAGILLLLPSIARYLGRAHAAAGDAAKGHSLLDEALTLTRGQRLAGLTAWCSSALGHAHMDGDTAKAETALHEALTMATEHGYAPVQAQTSRALGELRLRAADPSGAEALLRRAISLAEGMGMRPDLAGARRTLADALRALGRDNEALVEDDAAATLGLALRPTPAKARTYSDLVLLTPERKPER
jgi:tetratricopeptide (TPR) repeat protein